MIKLKPYIRSAGKLSAMNMDNGSLVDFTVTRNSESSEIDRNGYIRFVPANMPTFDWITKIEEDSEHYKFTPFIPVLKAQRASTNKISHPYDFEDTYWNKVGASIELDPSTAGSENITGTSSTLMRKADWTLSGEDETHILTDVTTGVRYQSDTTSPVLQLRQSGILDASKSYMVVINIASYTSGTIKSDFTPSISSIGTFTYYINGTSYFNLLRGSSDVDLVIGYVSIKEVTGFSSPLKDSSGNVLNVARKLVENNTANTTHRILVGYSSTASDTWSFTAIIKSNGRNARLSLVLNDDTNKYDQVDFDLVNGIYSGIGHGGVAKIKPLADGWFKCSFTLTGSNVQGITYYIYTLDGTSTVYDGNGTSGIYIAGAQFEKGNPTSIIANPESAPASSSRVADDISITTPTGVTKITETFVNDTENVITNIPTTYTLTNDKEYKSIIME